MNRLPDPPDLEPDEERVSEFALLVPAREEHFATEVKARLDQRALATNVAAASSWMALAAALQIFSALAALLGVRPDPSHPEEDTAHE